MPIPKIVGAQRDFSAGELDESMKRADENPIMKIGARQMSNWRILSSRALSNRPGRSALFLETGRVEKITMSPGNSFYLVFGNGYLRIYNAAGTREFNSTVKGDGSTAIPFTTATLQQITYAIVGLSIYIFYAQGAPNNVPQILTWDGVSQTSTWTLTTFAETFTQGGQKRTLFYRISPPNITIQPSATSGSVTLTASGALFVSGMIGTYLTYAGRELLITAVASSTSATATVVEPLPPAQDISLNVTAGAFNIGDLVEGSISGAKGIVTRAPTTQQISTQGSFPNINVGDTVTGGTSGATGIVTQVVYHGGQNPYIVVHLNSSTAFIFNETVTDTQTSATFPASPSGVTQRVQIIAGTNNVASIFTASDLIVGPSASASISSVTTEAPEPITVWADEVMNTFRGFPSSVFFDQNRLGLCNFPSVPSGIGWSAIGLPTDFYVNAQSTTVVPSSAIFELAPGKSQALYVVAGMESSEFVFTDVGIWYIPITPAIPLEPGSVAFNQLSAYGVMPNVQPRRSEQSIVYMKAGGGQVGAVQAPGAYYRPYVVDNISELHGHLFTASLAIAIAIPAASTQFEELYIYILLANGTLVVGKYAMRQGLIEPGPDGRPHVGWSPWSGAGTVTWVAALQDAVTFTTSYAPNNVTPVSVVEQLDNTQYLDGALLVNNLPAPFTPPGGKGPLYEFPGPNSTVFLIDLVTRFMGVYSVDANGNIIPQNIDGENLSSSQLVAGQNWTATLEPFAPDMSPGQDVHQRMSKRRVARMGVYVSNSTGLLMARLFSGPITPNSPALGTIMNTRRVETWNQGDDPTQPPPQREEAPRWRPLGRAFDPRVAVIKDTPGPLTVHEVSMEVSV